MKSKTFLVEFFALGFDFERRYIGSYIRTEIEKKMRKKNNSMRKKISGGIQNA